jgi:uncharacterized protein
MTSLIPIGLALILAQAPPAHPGTPGVIDSAAMFTPEAVARGTKELADIARASGWEVGIKTIRSVGQGSIQDATIAEAKAARLNGLFILISRDDKKLFAEPSPHAGRAFSKEAIKAIIGAIESEFKKGDFDEGLAAGIARVRKFALADPRTSEPVGVHDHAKMFSPEAIQKADLALRDLQRDTKWQVAIATVPTLHGEDVRKRAAADAATSKVDGLFVLIDKAEKTIGIVPSERARRVFTQDKIDSVIATLQKDFKAGEFDRGLLAAVQGLRDAGSAHPAAKVESPGTETGTSPKVPAPVTPREAPSPEVASRDPVAPQAEVKPNWPLYLGIGAALVFVLWLLSRAFSPKPAAYAPPAAPSAPGYAPTAANVPPQGYAPAGRPMPPGGGYGPPPPGYGPAQGYPQGGYAPQGGGGVGGGGFMSGALGGLGGAIAGNILYDRFGRPHESQAPPTHEGHMGGPVGYIPPAPPPTDPVPTPAETYDPNAGVEGSWGSDSSAPPASNDWVGSGASGGAGGDWNDPNQAAPDWGQPSGAPPDAEGAGGDWGAPAPEAAPEPDWSPEPPDGGGGGGGDWDAGSADPNEGQGGGW